MNIQQNDLMRHNLVVFRGGQGALKVLPPLVDVIPEARLNLVIYYLKHDGIEEASELLKGLEPSTPQEYVLKGVVHARIGQHLGNKCVRMGWMDGWMDVTIVGIHTYLSKHAGQADGRPLSYLLHLI